LGAQRYFYFDNKFIALRKFSLCTDYSPILDLPSSFWDFDSFFFEEEFE
jgi:hypothetical protein